MSPAAAGGEPIAGEAAAWVLRALVRDTTVQVRRNGAPLPPFAAQVMRALADAAGEHAAAIPGMADSGPTVRNLTASAMLPVTQAAHRAGCSARHVRRLAAAGRIRHQRIGERVLLIDIDSLLTVRSRTP